MKIKFPLYAKIISWFFLNLIILGLVFLFTGRGQFHFGLDALISGRGGENLQKVAQAISAELRDRPMPEWNEVLKRFGNVYNVRFFIFFNQEQLAGETITLPPDVHQRLALARHEMNPPLEFHDRRPQPDEPVPDGLGPPPREGEHPHDPPGGRRFMMHTSSPSRYWVVMRVMIPEPEFAPPPRPLMLVVESTSFTAGGLFFDLGMWLIVGLAVIVISVVFWFPLVRGITRSVSQMTRATERIAEGHFEVRTRVHRQDELGLLSDAINRMAARLAGFVAGQKRFLGDIAHELCSPIARIQVALGILEQRADEKQKVYLADLREEVEQMSSLVNELLSFSKASLGGPAVRLQPVKLRNVVEKTVTRECGTGEAPPIKIEVADDLCAMAEPELLLRALGNILRNAIRYAGKAGPISIIGVQAGTKIRLNIEDQGPGVPNEALAQVFDPFYRVDVSRDRETGGVGLGLSIVKTCIESCGGTVRCENREPQGLRVVIELTATSQN